VFGGGGTGCGGRRGERGPVDGREGGEWGYFDKGGR
jgi:hypothetical protein